MLSRKPKTVLTTSALLLALTVGLVLLSGGREKPCRDEIAFSVVEDDESRTHSYYVIRSNGRALKRLFTVTNASPVSWSPDGLKLAYFQEVDPKRPGDVELKIVNRSGKIDRSIKTPGGFIDSPPSWSHDGRYVVYGAVTGASPGQAEGPGDIYRLNVTSGRTKQLTSSDTSEVTPSYSPDDKRLVVATRPITVSLVARKLDFNAGLLDPDGGLVAQVNPERFEAFVPKWLPDGRIAFRGKSTAGASLGAFRERRMFSVSEAGARPKPLAMPPTPSFSFSPTGRRVAYTQPNRLNEDRLFVANAKASEGRRISELKAEDPSWCPAGGRRNPPGRVHVKVGVGTLQKGDVSAVV